MSKSHTDGLPMGVTCGPVVTHSPLAAATLLPDVWLAAQLSLPLLVEVALPPEVAGSKS